MPEGIEKTTVGKKPLEKMTAKDLRTIALAIPRDDESKAVNDMDKLELVSFIKNAQGIDEVPEAKKQKKQPHKKTSMSRGEIKNEISRLREERLSACEAGDTKKSDILRRKISRLKKLSRNVA